jgi:hypothetical protein
VRFRGTVATLEGIVRSVPVRYGPGFRSSGVRPGLVRPGRASVPGVSDDRMTAEAVHDTAVRRLQHAYADVVNRRAWPELEALFRPDADVVIDRRAGDSLRLVGGDEVGAFIGSAIAHFSFFEFVILNAHIVFPDGPEAGTAVCRLFMCELRQDDSGSNRRGALIGRSA